MESFLGCLENKSLRVSVIQLQKSCIVTELSTEL